MRVQQRVGEDGNSQSIDGHLVLAGDRAEADSKKGYRGTARWVHQKDVHRGPFAAFRLMARMFPL